MADQTVDPVDALEAEINSKFGTDHVHRIMAETVVHSAWLAERVRNAKAVGQANAVRNFSASLPDAVRDLQRTAWEEGAYAGREFQKWLATWLSPTGYGKEPTHAPNPYDPKGD